MPPTLFHPTPLFQSHHLLRQLGQSIQYKMECHQPTGSFKIRGMEHLVQHHMAQGKQHFVASSGGNAGYSVAYVGQQLGADVKVVVPSSTSEFMIQKIRNLGTEVTVVGEIWDEAHAHAVVLAEELQAVYVSPFDDPLLWAGHSTLVDELAQQGGQPDAIVVSVGGGGLLCGLLEGMLRHQWTSTRVITTETAGAASFAKSMEAGELITLPGINTVATSLGAKQVTARTLDLAQEFAVTPWVMPDEEAIQGARLFLDEYNTLVEPACGAALSIAYLHPEVLQGMEKVVVIACGGVSTPWDKYHSWLN
ncbi:MAG: pyridoxal-phosphate dependent enzyme [Bacteroidota bacterium]